MAVKRNSFRNLSEFGSVIEGLDDYESRPVRVQLGERAIESDRVYGMVNITQNHVTMPVGKNYPVFDHKTALGYVFKELDRNKIGVHGFVDTINDRTYSRILFDGATATDGEHSMVEIGMSFENPMDRKTRFKGYGYTWRQICSNGAGIKRMLPIMEINERHTREMEILVPPKIHDFVNAVLGQTNHMQTLIDNSMKHKVVFESDEQLLETLKAIYNNVSERHVKRIASKIHEDNGLDPTRWDMFNASNFVTSHSPVTPDIRSEIDRLAEFFLDVNVPIVPVTVVRKVTIEEEIVRRPSEFM